MSGVEVTTMKSHDLAAEQATYWQERARAFAVHDAHGRDPADGSVVKVFVETR
jgi:hypothetical protein